MKSFGPKREEITGEWNTLHNEELYDMYFSLHLTRLIISIIMRWTEHVARIEDERDAYRVLVGNPEGKSPL
jgi:hypothetical protein